MMSPCEYGGAENGGDGGGGVANRRVKPSN